METKKIIVGVTKEQIQNADSSYVVEILSNLDQEGPERVKELERSVSLMFPNIREYPLAFMMWAMGLMVKFPKYKHYLDKESIDLMKVPDEPCKCDTPLCAKCLSVGCKNKGCQTHTKEAKMRWRRNWEVANKRPFPKPENY